MKKSIGFIMVSCLLAICSCTTDEENFEEKKVEQNTAKSTGSVPMPQIIKNEIVIQYTEKNLEKKEIRKYYENLYKFKITDRKTCNCDNDDIELWTVDLTGCIFSTIEELKENLPSKDHAGGVETDKINADLNFYFKINNNSILGGNNTSSLIEKTFINNPGNAVNIAILDTGIDYSFFPKPFLYNSSNTSTCQDEISGWDFVNTDNDPIDDNGHGTMIAKIITDQLNKHEVPYTIMAVKAFDSNGKGSYWTAVCGINHIAKKHDNFIVNTSFGFYKINDQKIFKNIVDSANNKLLLVSSAGNLGVNTDIIGNEHFPSGYDSANILTVGGYIKGEFFTYPIYGSPYVSGLLKADRSNYGNSSIDALAPFDEHKITLVNSNISILENKKGTSFAAAEVTARAAQLSMQTSTTPLAIKNKTLESGFIVRDLNGYIDNGRVIVRNLMNPGARPTPTPASN